MRKQAIISSLNALEQGVSKPTVVRHLKENAKIAIKKGITREELRGKLQRKIDKLQES